MNPKPAQPYLSDALDGNRWMHIHNRFISETKEREPDVIIFGESIMALLEQRNVWTEVFVPMHALNFSIIGDQIENILWRIQNGELDNVQPKVVVLYAGTPSSSNDLQDAVDGVLKIVTTIREKQPNANILVQEALPRGMNPNPLRDIIENFNMLLKQPLQDIPQCKVVSVGSGIVKSDGTINHTDLFDWLYPTNDGYKKAFGPLISELKSLLYLED